MSSYKTDTGAEECRKTNEGICEDAAVGSGITSINGDGTVAQSIVGGTDINVSSSSGTTTITFNGFIPEYYASSKVNTNSTAVTSGTFTTFSNSPALSFTPTETGVFKVYCIPHIHESSSGDRSRVRIYKTSGSGTLILENQASVGIDSATDIGVSIYTESLYTLTGGVAYVFDVQALTNSSVTWKATDCDSYMVAFKIV